MMVERYPTLKKEVGGLIPGCEISSLLDRELARWSTASGALAIAYWPSVSTKEKRKKKNNFIIWCLDNKCLGLLKYSTSWRMVILYNLVYTSGGLFSVGLSLDLNMCKRLKKKVGR
jgi:hypothetical protein